MIFVFSLFGCFRAIFVGKKGKFLGDEVFSTKFKTSDGKDVFL